MYVTFRDKLTIFSPTFFQSRKNAFPSIVGKKGNDVFPWGKEEKD